MKIDNLKLRTKALVPLIVMSLAVFAMVGFGAYRLDGLARDAGEIIGRSDKAAIYVARATHATMAPPYAVFGALIYDGSSPEGRTAQADFYAQIDKLASLLDSAGQFAPRYAATFADFKKRFNEIAEKAKKPLAIGEDSPGLAAGADLSPADLGKLAEGAREVAAIDTDARALANGLMALSDTMINENARAAAEMADRSRQAIVTLAIVGALSALGAGALTAWISTMKTARPLAELSRRMNALAAGDLEVEVSGRERLDEIGDMARAVQVLKTHAAERLRLEARAEAERRSAEAERERTAAERAAAAAEQAEVVRRLGDGLRELADGDLMVKLGEGFSQTYAQIRDDFNEAIDKLKRTVLTVVSSAGAIRSGAQEISAASDDLSRRAAQQASALEETVATLNEVTATVKKAAEGAKLARDVVAAADEDAKKSALVVRQTVGAMNAIAESSRQIGQIIGVIDEIAFQTNLLALNAGVEAGRAGEAGRGFAVVASEVRALAQRSAEAAKKIKGLISSSGAQVDAGVALVAATGQSLERIIAQVAQINATVSDIAAGAQAQAAALQQINAAIEQMNQDTQRNAAMVEESTAAGRSLSDETTKLSRLVGQFRVGRAGAEEATRRRPAEIAPRPFLEPDPASAA
jgi:methyl-accepting chemotaxis protein